MDAGGSAVAVVAGGGAAEDSSRMRASRASGLAPRLAVAQRHEQR